MDTMKIAFLCLLTLYSLHSNTSTPLKKTDKDFIDFLDFPDVSPSDVLAERGKAPSPTGCEDLRKDCDWITNNHKNAADVAAYCKKYKGDPAVKMCHKTCGFCKAPSPTGCEDLRKDCDWITNNHKNAADVAAYCKKYKGDPAVKMCHKTCGFCKFPSPTKTPTRPKTEAPETERPFPPTKKPEPETPATETGGEKPVVIPTKPSTGKLTFFEQECLDAHNNYRSLHGVPPLKWSRDLARDAQRWADVLARENKFVHYKGLRELGQGENLAWFMPAKRECTSESDTGCVHCGEIVKDWYDEIKDYDFSKGAGKHEYSVVTHFTQVVWRATTEVGMASAIMEDRDPSRRKFFSVARYKPAGNQGSNEVFKENVPPKYMEP